MHVNRSVNEVEIYFVKSVQVRMRPPQLQHVLPRQRTRAFVVFCCGSAHSKICTIRIFCIHSLWRCHQYFSFTFVSCWCKFARGRSCLLFLVYKLCSMCKNKVLVRRSRLYFRRKLWSKETLHGFWWHLIWTLCQWRISQACRTSGTFLQTSRLLTFAPTDIITTDFQNLPSLLLVFAISFLHFSSQQPLNCQRLCGRKFCVLHRRKNSLNTISGSLKRLESDVWTRSVSWYTVFL